MNWYFSGRETGDIGPLRDEVVTYLRRHGETGINYDDVALVVSELLTNVWRHTAGAGWLEAIWGHESVALIVRDIGPGFDWTPTPPVAGSLGGRGLITVDKVVDDLNVARRDVGSTVTVTLPIRRAVAVSIDPPVRRVQSLPALEEATPDVGFGREAFLRALVVQLASTAELQLGPAVAEQLVAQVGIDVGTQMEAEYRAATGHDGPLNALQLGECFVRLKAAIGGGFRVVDIGDNHITLENDACPFGSQVQAAPGLCRMTSSVFGGIAARTTDSETVVSLDERIAVGDPQCKVTVTFGDAVQPTTWGHHYRPPL
jgi:anti-sigma regulatory factor (Ser/Thr protein kinase)